MKLYVMLCVLMLGVVGYIIVEFLHMRKKRRMKRLAEDPKAAAKEAVAAAEAAKAVGVPDAVEETDDERDDVDDDIIVTHL
jgi:hypothetical protein